MGKEELGIGNKGSPGRWELHRVIPSSLSNGAPNARAVAEGLWFFFPRVLLRISSFHTVIGLVWSAMHVPMGFSLWRCFQCQSELPSVVEPGKGRTFERCALWTTMSKHDLGSVSSAAVLVFHLGSSIEPRQGCGVGFWGK